MADFRLQIVTSQETIFDGPATALTLPGEEGYFGLMANHAAIVAVLRPGNAVLRRGSREQEFEVGAGFVEMSHNIATLLVDHVKGLETTEHGHLPVA